MKKEPDTSGDTEIFHIDSWPSQQYCDEESDYSDEHFDFFSDDHSDEHADQDGTSAKSKKHFLASKLQSKQRRKKQVYGQAHKKDDKSNMSTSTFDSKAQLVLYRLRQALPFIIMSLVAIIIGYILIDFPFNNNLWFLIERGWILTLANLFLLGLVYAFIYLIGQRTHTAIAVFLILCCLIGVANHYIIQFKGQPIIPADLMVLSTAIDVASSYTFFIDWVVIADIVLMVVSIVLLHFCPKAKRTKRTVITSSLAGVAAMAIFVIFMGTVDVDDDLGFSVSSWDPAGSFRENGAILCFLARVQDMTVETPEGYSEEAVSEILEPYIEGGAGESDSSTEATDATATTNITTGSSGFDLSAVTDLFQSDSQSADDTDSSETVTPHVIVIMNESFADLSYVSDFEGTALELSEFYEICAEAVLSGTAYSSVLGTATCNSEFEFLTFSTMAGFDSDSRPYSLYNLSDAYSLVQYFNDLGYDTTAVHPAEASNWNRDRVYPTLGFDEFDDITAIEDPSWLRYYYTDATTYEHVLEIITESDSPQFVFDVTIQNHGGYLNGGIEEQDYSEVVLSDGTVNEELSEYASLIQQAEEDIVEFINALRELDEPVIVCFFGDHQPSFTDNSIIEAYVESVGDSAQRYAVPYFIWTNYDTGWETGVVEDTSLNYLASTMLDVAGLPTNALLDFIRDTHTAMPVVTAFGYRDEEGVWHSEEDVAAGTGTDSAAEAAATAYKNLLLVQYANLFEDWW